MAVKELSDGNPDGTRHGQSSTDLVGFHGASPSDQRAVLTFVSSSVPTQATAGYGFVTSTQFSALIDAVNEIINTLREKGLMASS